MIKKVKISNYRCFKSLELSELTRVNVFVGDNGVGKTSLLEAVFLALGVTPELGVRYRQLRGMDGAFSGSARKIEEAVWKNLFFRDDWANPISIELSGDGDESRRVSITRQPTIVPLSGDGGVGPIKFSWTDSAGQTHEYTPKLTAAGMQIPASEEDLPDFFYFGASQNISSAENAGRFSELTDKARRRLVDTLRNEYSWVEDLGIEVSASAPYVSATLANGDRRPLAMFSGGVNRIVAIMLAMASRQRSVVIVDEVENGIYYRHQHALWKSMLDFSKEFSSQLFFSSHSHEWIKALVDSVDDEIDQVTLWRLERDQAGYPVILRFSGNVLKAGMEGGAEVRGGVE